VDTWGDAGDPAILIVGGPAGPAGSADGWGEQFCQRPTIPTVKATWAR